MFQNDKFYSLIRYSVSKLSNDVRIPIVLNWELDENKKNILINYANANSDEQGYSLTKEKKLKIPLKALESIEIIDKYVNWLSAKEQIKQKRRDIHSEETKIQELEIITKNLRLSISIEQISLEEKEILEKRIKTEESYLNAHKNNLTNFQNDIKKLESILEGDWYNKKNQTLINDHFGLSRFLDNQK